MWTIVVLSDITDFYYDIVYGWQAAWIMQYISSYIANKKHWSYDTTRLSVWWWQSDIRL